MFTGFASENTPAVQVWDFARPYASNAVKRSIALADDCAPIQFFKTGSVADLDINVYLPTGCLEGKSITIVNAQFANAKQSLAVYSAESFYGTSVILFKIGQGQKVEFIYSNVSISSGTSNASFPTCWISLDLAHKGALNNGSAIVGGYDNSTANEKAFVGGGSSNTASGSSSFVGGGSNNLASNSQAFVGGGNSNTASGINSFASGTSNTASGNQSFVAGGSNTASAVYSTVIGGAANTANAEVATVIGGYYGTTRSIVGNTVFPANGVPIVSTAGASQSSLLVLGRQTTDATATVLRSNTSAASGTNQVILPNNSAYTFQGTCIANVTGGSTTSGWKYEGVIKRGANAASTALVAAVTPIVIAQDVAAATWVLAITADTTNGGIAVTVTGAAATTIRWVSRIETTEVTF